MAIRKHYYRTREEWLSLREELGRNRLGGSELGSASGHNEHKSAYRLWAERCGFIAAESVDDRESVRLGRDLEDYVANRFAETSGKKVHNENCIFMNDSCPHLLATIDRKIANEASGLECKTAIAYRSGDFGGDVFPASYYAQMLAYLAVTGLERWYLAVLVMGVGFRVFMLTRKREDIETPKPAWLQSVTLVDEDEIASCETVAARFLKRVESVMWPAEEIDGSESTRTTLMALSPADGSESVDLSQTNALELIESRTALNAEITALDERVAQIDNQLRNMLGRAQEAFLGGYRLSCREQVSNRLNAAAVKAFFEGRDDAPKDLYRSSVSRPLKITVVKKRAA